MVIASFLLTIFSSCKPKISTKNPSAGEITATRFVSIGGALTAGFMDDALFFAGQENSVGNIFAGQLHLVGNLEFLQPLIQSADIGCNAEGKSSLILGYKTDCLGITSLSPVRTSSTGDLALFQQNNFTTGFHNFGVPGLKAVELTQNGLGNSNPYFARMASNPTSSQVLSDALSMNPTFFSFFVGMDEVLAYAKKGAAIGNLTPVFGTDGNGFSGSIQIALNKLTENGAKGVVANIPDVTVLPFFTTIPYDGLNLTPEKVASLNQIYNPIGISFQVGANPFMIEDPTAGVFGVRKMVPGELLLLSVPLDSVKCFQMGSVFPLRNEFVLTLAELEEIRVTTQQYNTILEIQAAENNLALTDLEAFYQKLATGIMYNGIGLNLKFVSGGTVSLDGLTLNPKGNALLTNEFIKSVNNKYNATIPLVDVTNYRSTYFP
ncbi:MAG: hypothetical protein RL679_395 [Bacteroidota bacterium]